MLRLIFISILILLFAGFVFIGIKVQNSLPDYNGTQKLEGISHETEVHFDDFGVPHIYAESETDAYQALGFLHAQERLFQMEMIRRVCAGRLSEVFGPDLIEVDKYFKTIGIHRHAEQLKADYFNSNNEPHQLAAQAYLDGVNNFIALGKTPPEFTLLGIKKEPFDQADMLQVAGYMSLGFAGGLEEDLLVNYVVQNLGTLYAQDLAIDYIEGTQQIASYSGADSLLSDLSSLQSEVRNKLPIPLLVGSNAWVVGPSRSTTGHAILCNDTHIGFGQPAVWYEAHLNYPGQNFFGKFLAGFPFAPIGNNDFSTVGITMFCNDDINLHLEEINDKNEFKTDQGWKPLGQISETIVVKDSSDVEFTIRYTDNGPIVSNISLLPTSNMDQAISLWWLYLKQPGDFVKAAYQWSYAKNINDVQRAASLVGAPGLNVMTADQDQNIAWFATARLPVYDQGSPKFLMGANEAPSEFLDFNRNPHSINPPSGYVYSANNQPATFEGYFHPGYYTSEDRAKRINHRIDAQETWSLDELKSLQFDNIAMNHKRLIRILKDSKIQSTHLPLLEAWNGNHEMASTEATLYNYLMAHILELSFMDEMKEEAFKSFLKTHLIKRTIYDFLENEQSIWWDNIETTQTESRSDIIQQAMDQTDLKLKKLLGNDPSNWTWGKMHTITHKHSFDAVPAIRNYFNVGPAPSSGGNMVLNNTGYVFDTDSIFQVTFGPAMRTIVHLTNPIEVYTILPTGQSGHFLSPHYDDQFELYNEGRYQQVHLNYDSTKVHAKSTLILKP